MCPAFPTLVSRDELTLFCVLSAARQPNKLVVADRKRINDASEAPKKRQEGSILNIKHFLVTGKFLASNSAAVLITGVIGKR